MSTGYAVAEQESVSLIRPKKKVKKPGFIKRWLLNQLKSAIQEEKEDREMNQIKVPRGLEVSPRTLDSDKGIRFQIYRANGGFVVETGMYDRRTDRHSTSLHVITDEKDLGSEIGKIITMETLKQ